MHCNGSPLTISMVDLTRLQSLFLQLMSAERIKEEMEHKVMLKALCESQGIKFNR